MDDFENKDTINNPRESEGLSEDVNKEIVKDKINAEKEIQDNTYEEGVNAEEKKEIEKEGEETKTLPKLEKLEEWKHAFLRVHYRFIPFFHKDYIKSRRWFGFLGPFHPYGILNNVYRFLADVFEYKNKKRKYIGTITEPGIKEKKYRTIYYRAMFIYTPSGELDPTNEICEDTPQEHRINIDPEKPPKLCFYANLQSITPPDYFKDHQVQQREKEFHETIWAVPINALKYIPVLIFSKKKTKIMELGELYDINNEFVKGDGDLTLNENVIKKILTLGAVAFDLEYTKEGTSFRVASIHRAPWKRLLTFGIWKDYYIKIYDERYNRLDFKVFLSLITDMINNRGRIRKHVRGNMELKVPVRNIMRYST